MMNISRTLGALAAACLAWAAHAADPVELEVFKGPEARSLHPPAYPESERKVGNEGWVQLNLMVDPQGKPYEISVMNSTGNKVFEEAALRMVERASFEPARLGDHTIDSGTVFKVLFYLDKPARGARSAFVREYNELIKAIGDGERTRADASLAKLNVMNMYEDAYRNLAQFRYAQKWGTEDEQLVALKGALAGETSPRYLEKKTFIEVLNARLFLQIKAQDVGGALKTWEGLKDIDPKGSAHWQPTVDQLGKLIKTDMKFRIVGSIRESGHAFSELFRKRFSVEVASGSISDLKLRCEKQYLIFRYQPDIEYSIDGRNSECTLELVGEPGTTYTLVQH